MSAGIGTEPSYSHTPRGPVPVEHTVVCVYESPDQGYEVRHRPGMSILGDKDLRTGKSILVGDSVHECWFSKQGRHYLCAAAGGGVNTYLNDDKAFLGGQASACEIQDSYRRDTCYHAVVVLGFDEPTRATTAVTFAAAVCRQHYNWEEPSCVFVDDAPARDLVDRITFTRISQD